MVTLGFYNLRINNDSNLYVWDAPYPCLKRGDFRMIPFYLLVNQVELARAKHAKCPSKHSWNLEIDTCKDCGILREEYEDFIVAKLTLREAFGIDTIR